MRRTTTTTIRIAVRGWQISLNKDESQKALLPQGLFEIYKLENCKASAAAISLRESADGNMPCGSLDGHSMHQCGQEAVHASHSPSQEKAEELQMSGICGQNSLGSLSSADLQLFLENKLH